MRIAIPVADGWVERVFDSATTLLIVDVVDRSRRECYQTPVRIRSVRERAHELALLGVDELICDEISNRSRGLVADLGITVRSGNSGLVEELMESLGCAPGESQPSRRRRAVVSA
jgi:predicted Fe-Mo cluster-binding NifX family protein